MELMSIVALAGIACLYAIPVWLFIHLILKCVQLTMRGEDCRREEWMAAFSLVAFVAGVIYPFIM